MSVYCVLITHSFATIYFNFSIVILHFATILFFSSTCVNMTGSTSNQFHSYHFAGRFFMRLLHYFCHGANYLYVICLWQPIDIENNQKNDDGNEPVMMTPIVWKRNGITWLNVINGITNAPPSAIPTCGACLCDSNLNDVILMKLIYHEINATNCVD